MIVSVEYLSEFFKKDVRTIQLWAARFLEQKGVQVRADRGEYDFLLFVKCRFEELEEELTKARHTTPQDTLALVNAELKELQKQRELGNLIEASEVSDAWGEQISIIVAKIDGIFPRMALSLDDDQKIKLQSEIDKTKESIAATPLEIQRDI